MTAGLVLCLTALLAGNAVAQNDRLPREGQSLLPAAGRNGAVEASGDLPPFLQRPGKTGQARQPAPPDTAFTLTVTAADTNTLVLRFDIDDCCYLYRDKLRFILTELDGTPLSDGLRLGTVELPRGSSTTDAFFGESEIYRGTLEVRLPLIGVPRDAEFALAVTYQGCSEKGVSLCYEPITRRFVVRAERNRLTVGAPIAAGPATRAYTGFR